MLVGGGRLAAALMALVSIRVVTTFLTPEQYGELALLIAIQMFCGLLFVNPVGQHINLHTHAWWDDGTLLVRLRSYKYFVLAVSLVGSIVAFFMGGQISMEQHYWVALAVFAIVLLGTWNATLVPMLNLLGYRGSSVFWSIITVLIGLVSSVVLVIWSQTSTAWLAGQAIGMGAGALGAKYVLKQHAAKPKISQDKLPLLDRATILKYCLPLALATGLMWLQLSGYRFLVEGYWGLAQLGFLALGMQLAGQIWNLAESLAMQFLSPLFYRRISAFEDRSEVELAFSDLLNTLVPIYLVLTGMMILIAPYLLRLLVSSQFWDAINYLIIGVFIELCRVLGNLLGNAAHANRQTKSLAFPYSAGAFTTLALLYVAGVWQLDILWAGAGILAGGVAMFAAMLVNMYRQVKFSLDVGRCCVGLAAMCSMIVLAIWLPIASGLVAAVTMLFVIVIPACFVMLVLLWRNPATLRLLEVQLRRS